MVNVLLLLSSLVLLFMGIILRINYFMDKLGFITVYFEASSVSTYIRLLGLKSEFLFLIFGLLN
jgi:hypothetical protein